MSYKFLHLENQSPGLSGRPLEPAMLQEEGNRSSASLSAGIQPAFLGVGSGVLFPWSKRDRVDEPGGCVVKLREPAELGTSPGSAANAKCRHAGALLPRNSGAHLT